jgi:integrase
MPKLTDRIVKGLKPPTTATRISKDGKSYRASKNHWDSDVHGFGIRVTASGCKSFILNYRTRAGRVRQITIGEWPTYSTDVARAAAKEHRYTIDRGGDPAADRKAVREAPTFKDLADKYIEEHLPKKRASSAKTDKEAIDKVLLPALGRHKVADITFDDVNKIHRRITERGKPYRANRVVALLSKMFALAVKNRWLADNPAKGIERNQEKKRARYLTDDELTRLTGALAAHPDQRVANAIRLLLLTGARRGEVLSMTWGQINFEKGIWTKPGATTKQKTEHVVPLSPPAVLLLSTMRQGSTSDYVFPSRDGTGHRVDLKKPWPAICKAAGINGLRVHDLRHSYASFLVSAGLSLPVIGALLGHTQPQTTARYAHLHDDPLRKATERVGALIEGAGKAGAKVVKMRG